MSIFNKLFFNNKSYIEMNVEEGNIISTEFVCEVVEPPAIGSYRKIAFLEKVVRCCDCEYYVEPEDLDLKPYCINLLEGTAITPNTYRRVKSDGFCAWGKCK